MQVRLASLPMHHQQDPLQAGLTQSKVLRKLKGQTFVTESEVKGYIGCFLERGRIWVWKNRGAEANVRLRNVGGRGGQNENKHQAKINT